MPIIVAPGKLWLTVTHVFVAGLDLSIRDGARIGDVWCSCGDFQTIAVTFNGCGDNWMQYSYNDSQ